MSLPNREYVLQVEDNRLDTDLLRKIFQLNRISHDIVSVPDGEKALEFLLETEAVAAHPPRAILLDLKLPKVTGIEVLQKLRTSAPTKNIPVVVLSSSKDRRDVDESYRYGANSYLCKPVGFSEYEEMMRVFAEYWLETNQPAHAH